jgi:DNA ligase-1
MEMHEEKVFPTLFGLASNDVVKQWLITVHDGFIGTIYGTVGGKQTVNSRPVIGKNIGKSNETTPYDQACLEAESKWKKKVDKGYRLSVEELHDLPILPMKLQVYENHKDKIIYPALAQPKLNGVKAIVTKVDENTVTYKSNGGKFYTTLSHLDDGILATFEVGDSRDGEIYLHGAPLQKISAAVKKVNTLTPSLQFWMYDSVDLVSDFSYRNSSLLDTMYANPQLEDDHIVVVYGTVVKDEEAYDNFHNRMVADYFEGTVIRNLAGLYKPGYRSYDAQKRKDFKDEEFKIIGYDCDVDGKVIWICNVDGVGTFKCVPVGTDEDRKMKYNHGYRYCGKWLTVKYLEKSESGVPQGNPVGICIRDYE